MDEHKAESYKHLNLFCKDFVKIYWNNKKYILT